jgi:two-component system KDP operon response regulator KdpE
MALTARILVVDDEAAVRFVLEEALTRDGHQVVAADSGEAALALIADQEYDLALLDLMMDEVGGMEVLAALRRRWPDMVVIVLTAHASLETAVEALRQGAHDYLFKPCETAELRESVRTGLLKRQQEQGQRSLLSQLERSLASSLEEIRAAASKEPPAAPSAPGKPEQEEGARFLKRGRFVVDLVRHVITLDGHLLELSPTEFDLLAYMIGESPRVISPQELVREVQGYEIEAWEARDMVRYHVYRIRQKVKPVAPGQNVIRTVRGVGYTVSD